jgi:hypothetical protein
MKEALDSGKVSDNMSGILLILNKKNSPSQNNSPDKPQITQL